MPIHRNTSADAQGVDPIVCEEEAAQGFYVQYQRTNDQLTHLVLQPSVSNGLASRCWSLDEGEVRCTICDTLLQRRRPSITEREAAGWYELPKDVLLCSHLIGGLTWSQAPVLISESCLVRRVCHVHMKSHSMGLVRSNERGQGLCLCCLGL